MRKIALNMELKNNLNEDGDEADDHVDDEEEGDVEKETGNGETDSDTENDEVDPWEKLREDVLNGLTSAWEEQLRSKLLPACFLFTPKSYDT